MFELIKAKWLVSAKDPEQSDTHMSHLAEEVN